jgi:cytoskeletal protein CcmA (bactofilin family)
MPELEETTKTAPRASTIGPTAKLKGEWTCDEEVVVQGTVQGKIDSGNHSLRIEKGATANADIRGKNIIIKGKVTGNVTASEKIVIGEEAEMIGDLTAPQISIREGARFKGTVKMIRNSR